MVPKQCTLLTPTFSMVPHLFRYVPWFVIYFQIPYIPSHPDAYMTDIGISSIVRLRLRAFGAQPLSELVIACMA